MGKVANGLLKVWAYPEQPPVSGHVSGGSIPRADCWPYHVVLDGIASSIARVQQVNPEYYIIQYTDMNDLMNQISGLMNTQTWVAGTPPVTYHSPCLRVLEICSHANPNRCGGICPSNLKQFAAQLDSMKVCDELDVFLSGCNTGTRDEIWKKNIAEELADLVPSVARRKQYRCTVWGTKGYQSGSNAEKNSSVSKEYTDSEGVLHKSYFYSQDQTFNPSLGRDFTYYPFRGPNSA